MKLTGVYYAMVKLAREGPPLNNMDNLFNYIKGWSISAIYKAPVLCGPHFYIKKFDR